MKTLQEFHIPKEDASTDVVTILSIFFSNGAHVKTGDVVLEFETSKNVYSIEAEIEGYIHYNCQEDDELEIGGLAFTIYDEQETENPKDAQSAELSQEECSENVEEPAFTHAALELIEQHGLAKTLFYDKEFVTIDHVKEFLRTQEAQLQIDSTPAVTLSRDLQKKTTFSLKNVTLERVSAEKKVQIRHLSAVQSGNLTSTVHVYVDTSAFFSRYHAQYPMFQKTLLPVIVWKLGELLQQYREFNACFLEKEIAFYNDINIGIGIDLEYGLKVVKVEDVPTKSLEEIEEILFDLTMKYLDNALEPDDLVDTTFTISDLSGVNVSSFDPLINKNQSAILGVSAIDAQLQRCDLSLTFDHRVADGKNAGLFLTALKKEIESYRS